MKRGSHNRLFLEDVKSKLVGLSVRKVWKFYFKLHLRRDLNLLYCLFLFSIDDARTKNKF